MARVEIASMPWGTVQDGSGNAQSGVTVNLKNLDGTAATTWSAVTGGASSTASLTTDINGTLPRFVDGGQYQIDIPALSITGRRVEAALGAVVEKAPALTQEVLPTVATVTALRLRPNASQSVPLLIVNDEVDRTGQELRVGKEMTEGQPEADGAKLTASIRTATPGVNEYGIVSRIRVDAHTAATGSAVKAAVLGQARTNVNNASTLAKVDGIGGFFQGYITSTTPVVDDGMAWGQIAEAYHSGTGADGQLIGTEIGVYNNGSVVTNIGADIKMKTGAWFHSGGSAKGSAMIANTSAAPGWHWGMYLRSCAVFARFDTPLVGSSAIGIDMKNSADWSHAIVMPNSSDLRGYNAAGSSPLQVLRVDSLDRVRVGMTTPLILADTGSSVGFFQVAPVTRRGGWTAATGTLTRTTFATSTVTLPVLAEHVAALITDLLSYGLLGP